MTAWLGFGFCRGPAFGFFWRRRISAMADRRHHGEGEHRQGHMTMPTMPGPGLVVIEPELVFRGLKAILELSLNLGDGSDHAACCAGVSMICTPSRNLAPWMTLGKRFSPFSFRHVLAAAATNLNTISLAVFGESAPFVRTVR